ncbi:MAG TPA: hypothetical protein VEO01_40570 [Pseudonocardiaceae bacterium]|nr:hypothetical protein [Pseudonocardiaceae bacterium]
MLGLLERFPGYTLGTLLGDYEHLLWYVQVQNAGRPAAPSSEEG